MALTCARCGAQNPEGNAFCQACGTPLTAVAAAVAPGNPPWSAAPPPGPPPGGVAGPPPGLAPPMQTMGGGYQSPYYVPTAPHAPVHRTPWTLIISAVVVLVIAMAGCGTLLAVLASRGAVTVGGGITSGLPSPTPGGTPSPLVTPTGPTTGPGTVSNVGVVVPVPAGWTVATKDAESVTLSDPNGTGFITVASGPSSPAANSQQNKDQLDAFFKSHYPDTKPCPGTNVTAGSVGSAKGFLWTLCFTLTSGSRAAPAVVSLFAGANGDGTVYYAVMELTSPPSNLQAVVSECKPILQGIQWKLS
jgi:zinc ribbon protein